MLTSLLTSLQHNICAHTCNSFNSDKLCDLISIHVATGEDSGYTFSTGMIGGAIVVVVLLLIILVCAVGCCVIWARRKKTPMSSVYYSNVKSVDNFEGLQLVWGLNTTDLHLVFIRSG